MPATEDCSLRLKFRGRQSVIQLPSKPRRSGTLFARAALEHGLRFTQMEADWASWVLDELDKRGD